MGLLVRGGWGIETIGHHHKSNSKINNYVVNTDLRSLHSITNANIYTIIIFNAIASSFRSSQ